MAIYAKNNPNHTPQGNAAMPPSATKLRKGTPQIVLPAQEINVGAVRSFMLDCLVPILAEEFLRRRDHPKRSQAEPISSNRTIAPLGKENGR